MSSKINLQPCEYARKSSIFQDNQLISMKKENLYKNYIIFSGKRQAFLYILYDLHNKNCNNLQEKTVRLLPVRTVFS